MRTPKPSAVTLPVASFVAAFALAAGASALPWTADRTWDDCNNQCPEPNSWLGSSGNDLMYSRGLADNVAGDAAPDHIYLGFDDDSGAGLAGADEIHGEDGIDVIHGHDGADEIWGGELADDLYGDNNSDEIHAGAGPDDLHGGDGDDILYGGDGNDALYGGAGYDLCYGGSGTDSFSGCEGP